MDYNILSLDKIRAFLSTSNLKEQKQKFFNDYFENVGDVSEIDHFNGVITNRDNDVYLFETNVSIIFNSLFKEFKYDVNLFFIKYYNTNRINGYKKYLIRSISLILNNNSLLVEFPYAIRHIKSIIEFLNKEYKFEIKIDELFDSIPISENLENTVDSDLISKNVEVKTKKNRNLINSLKLRNNRNGHRNPFHPLYEFFTKEGVIHSEDIPKNSFIDILCGKKTEENVFIKFQVNNSLAIGILEALKPLYKEYDAGIVERYAKFKTKQGNLITQSNYNRTRKLSEKDKIYFDEIKNKIIELFPEIN